MLSSVNGVLTQSQLSRLTPSLPAFPYTNLCLRKIQDRDLVLGVVCAPGRRVEWAALLRRGLGAVHFFSAGASGDNCKAGVGCFPHPVLVVPPAVSLNDAVQPEYRKEPANRGSEFAFLYVFDVFISLADAIEEAIFVPRRGRYIPQYIRARYGALRLQQTVPVEASQGQRCSAPKRPSRNECRMKAGQIRRREP
jgi:hypothetical protein